MKYTVKNITGENALARTKTIHVVKRGQYIALAPGESTVMKEWEVAKILETIATKDSNPKNWDRHTYALVEEFSVSPKKEYPVKVLEPTSVVEEDQSQTTDSDLQEEIIEPTIYSDLDIDDNEVVNIEKPEETPYEEVVDEDVKESIEEIEDVKEEPEYIDITLETIKEFKTKKDFIEFLESNGYGHIGSMDKKLKEMKEELSDHLGL